MNRQFVFTYLNDGLINVSCINCRLLVEILKETADINEIQFNENGSWSPVESSENVVHYNSAKRKSGIEDLGFSHFSSGKHKPVFLFVCMFCTYIYLIFV